MIKAHTSKRKWLASCERIKIDRFTTSNGTINAYRDLTLLAQYHTLPREGWVTTK